MNNLHELLPHGDADFDAFVQTLLGTLASNPHSRVHGDTHVGFSGTHTFTGRSERASGAERSSNTTNLMIIGPSDPPGVAIAWVSTAFASTQSTPVPVESA